MNSFEESIKEIKKLTNKENVLFMNKCREAAELLMILAKNKGLKNLILQEEGGWHTYEKSGIRQGLKILKAPMNKGTIIKEKFPFSNNDLIIINTNPGYAYVEKLEFLDEMNEKNKYLVVNDVVSSIGEEYAKKGDFIIGSFGKDKPLSIDTGGAFIAFNNFPELKELKEKLCADSGKNINFDDLLLALKNFNNKKQIWIKLSNKLKSELKSKGFEVLNNNESINVLVKTNMEERENLIKFCEEHNLEYLKCPLYIRTNEEALSIEIKKKKLEG